MNQVDVKVISAEAREAPLHRSENMPTGQARLDDCGAHAIGDLGRDYHFFAARADRLTEYSLGLASSVDVR